MLLSLLALFSERADPYVHGSVGLSQMPNEISRDGRMRQTERMKERML